MTMFIVEGLGKRFGGVIAADNVYLAIEPNQVHAIIGPNGAGKSTVVNMISGMLSADSGSIMLDGLNITNLPPYRRVWNGLSRCFQTTSLFGGMTVRENLKLAVQASQGTSFSFFADRSGEDGLDQAAQILAARVGLGGVLDQTAGTLSYGSQRKLDIALSLASRPKLLLLDEPMAGLGTEEISQAIEMLKSLRDETAILLVEHDMGAVFELADTISVLVGGRILASGSPAEIKRDPKVREAYLGSEDDEEAP